MRVSHAHRLIFYSNPKCGSQSVREILVPFSDPELFYTGPDSPLRPHAGPDEVREHFLERGWPFSEYRSFVTVRNPWARLVSFYEFLRQAVRHEVPDFRSWLSMSVTGGAPTMADYTIDRFVGDGAGGLWVDRVLRLEDLDRELVPYLQSLGVRCSSVPRINGTDHGSYVDYYDDEARELVRRVHAVDVERFGYRFGD